MDPQFQQDAQGRASLAEAFEQGVDVFVCRGLAPRGVVFHVNRVVCSRHGAHGACTTGHLQGQGAQEHA